MDYNVRDLFLMALKEFLFKKFEYEVVVDEISFFKALDNSLSVYMSEENGTIRIRSQLRYSYSVIFVYGNIVVNPVTLPGFVYYFLNDYEFSIAKISYGQMAKGLFRYSILDNLDEIFKEVIKRDIEEFFEVYTKENLNYKKMNFLLNCK